MRIVRVFVYKCFVIRSFMVLTVFYKLYAYVYVNVRLFIVCVYALEILLKRYSDALNVSKYRSFAQFFHLFFLYLFFFFAFIVRSPFAAGNVYAAVNSYLLSIR